MTGNGNVHAFSNDNDTETFFNLQQKISPKYGTENLKFYHFNARPHFQKDIKKYLETQNLKVIIHPTYSPDLALCDFNLKVIYKQRLSNHFDCERLSNQVTVMVSEIPEFEYRKDLNMWIEVMQASLK
jgi:hypothetical protein